LLIGAWCSEACRDGAEAVAERDRRRALSGSDIPVNRFKPGEWRTRAFALIEGHPQNLELNCGMELLAKAEISDCVS
jgi:hypothetical protein